MLGRELTLPVIKRYSNRKLYNTQTRHYVTLEDIATMIQAGEDVLVTDHVSGEDLTTMTLAQILMELEKQPGGVFPGAVFEKIIQNGQEKLPTYRKAIQSILDPSSFVDEAIVERLKDLLDQKKINPQEYDQWKSLLLPEIPSSILPESEMSASEVQDIQAKISELEKEIARMKLHLYPGEEFHSTP